MLGANAGCGKRDKYLLQQAGSHSEGQEALGGDTTQRATMSRCQVVSGATLDAHWLHAAKRRVLHMWPPPFELYSRVVPVDAHPPML